MGFFDKKSSSSSSTSASQTTPTAVGDASSAFGLGNISTGKKSSVNVALTMSDYGAIGGALDMSGKVVSDALNYAEQAGGTAAALAYDGVNKALNFADTAARDNAALTGWVLDKQTVANLEFLGEVSKFSELSSQTAREQAEFSERQAALAIGQVARANSDALSMGARFAQDAQTASLKALDMVFESTKSETARLSEISMKWIVVAAVAVFVVPFLVRK